ncbi:MAG TPA: aldo/keto reductase [Hyphomicrobiaceae bacterium]|nr:aldo/keto reductase [Hyphomicrobiaceae bacterium]
MTACTSQLAALPKRPLGRTGIEVTALGFGSAPLGDIYEILDDDAAIRTVERAADNGITLFDTAPLYGQGSAEHRVGTALRRQPQGSFVLSTKVGRILVPAPAGRIPTTRFVGGLSFDVVNDYSYDAAMRSHEHSLHRLGLPKVDILLIHDADAWGHGPVEGPKRYREAMEGAYRALEKLRAEGVIKAIGIGLNDPVYAANFLRDGDFDCLLMAGRYSLLEQPALAEVLPLASEKNVGVLLGGVFNSGILATGSGPDAKYNYLPAPPEILDKVARIEKVCASHHVPLPTAAMQFCLGHPAVSSLVLGAVKPSEVERNCAAAASPIPTALWSDLKSEGLLDPAAPTPA